jgi:histidine triad (HIT) family protein
MEDCLFCKIISKQIKSEFVYEDDDLICIKDIHPQAPVHLLIIPKKHISTILDVSEDDEQLIGKMARTASKISKQFNINESGFRLIFNCNKNGGQTIYHIHLHLMGGKRLKWTQ